MESDHYKEGCWWTSPYNGCPEVAKECRLAHRVEIHDATLRDGEQTAGVSFSLDDKVRIAEKLDEIGVEIIEIGSPASDDNARLIETLAGRGLKARMIVFTQTREDIDKALDGGARSVLVEAPIGYPKLKHQFGWTWEDVLEKSVDRINHARAKGLSTLYFPYDTTRAREEDLERLMAGIMEHSPPDAVAVVDSMGSALPRAVQYLVRKMKSMTRGLPVEVHTHNDFGMALATELAGIEAGAGVAHSCVNGLGERTGNAATEELMTALKILYGVDNAYRLDKLAETCRMVEKFSGAVLADNKPIIGKRCYTRELGSGVDLVLREPLAMFATDPRCFGRVGEIVLGKKSGKASVAYFLQKNGMKMPDAAVDLLLVRVKEAALRKKSLLTNEEFLDIASGIGR